MKLRLMELLRCPNCLKRFKLVVPRGIKNKFNYKSIKELKNYEEEIIEGLLNCICGKQYPIVNGIPRILPNAFQKNPLFYEKYRGQINQKIDSKKIDGWEKEYKQTQQAFELQWKKHGESKRIYGRTKDEMMEYFFKEANPKKITPAYFKNKLCVEGGCGHGTYLQILAELGAEVVGMDLGVGADIAYKKCRHLPKAHVIQTNIMHPPLIRYNFDYVYSFGVIHHTPNTKKAFSNLAKLTKKEGYFAIWVYPVEGKLREVVSGILRKITTKLPLRLLYYLCYIPVPLLTLARPYSGTHLGRNTWKECVECLYDWFSPVYQTHHTPQEVVKWFEEESFEKIEILPLATGVTGIKK